jgi:hypothetical protein
MTTGTFEICSVPIAGNYRFRNNTRPRARYYQTPAPDGLWPILRWLTDTATPLSFSADRWHWRKAPSSFSRRNGLVFRFLETTLRI